MTDKTLFIHAGGSKTGSSALQNFFYFNASRLESLGFAFENRLTHAFGSNNGMLLYNALSSTATEDNEIDSLILSYFGQCKNAVCSSEYFQLIEVRGWRKLLESTARLGLKLKVIFYVRNVIPFFLSSYDQSIKCHGEWKLFDDWVLKQDWQHLWLLRIIADQLPQENIYVLHFDRVKGHLIRIFLDVLGIDSSYELDQNNQDLQVNRSLTSEEREALITVNRIFGGLYSTELTNFLIHANPNVRGEPVSCHKATMDSLLARFSNEVDWVNNTFFDGQAVVSVLPIESVKNTLNGKLTIKPEHHSDVEKRVLGWALEKLKTIQSETEQRLLNVLNDAAQNVSGKSYPDIPADFDALAYLLLNPDVLRAGFDPIQHFIIHGKQEGRVYKILDR